LTYSQPGWVIVKEETYAALMRLQSEGETVDELIQRLLKYAQCYMIIRGAEDSEEKSRADLKRLEEVKDFVLSRRDDIETDVENFGVLKPVLKHFLEEVEGDEDKVGQGQN